MPYSCDFLLSQGWETTNPNQPFASQRANSKPQHKLVNRLATPNSLELPVQLFRQVLGIAVIVLFHVHLLSDLDGMRKARPPKSLKEEKRHSQAHGRRLYSEEPSS